MHISVYQTLSVLPPGARGCAQRRDAEMVRLGPCLQGAHSLVFPKGTTNLQEKYVHLSPKSPHSIPQSSYVMGPCSMSVPG